MRSISIVYKKSRRQPHEELKSSPNIRRSVDEFYTKLMEKQKNKQFTLMRKREMIERMKLKTSKAMRQGDKYQLLESMNIMQAPFTLSDQEKYPQVFKRKEKTFSIKRLQNSKFIIKGIFNKGKSLNQEQDQESEQNPNLNSKTAAHAKLKNLYTTKRNKEIKGVVVVLSVDFIINEMNFWEEEQVDEICVKFWKTLQNHTNIVWICTRESTCKKLIKFASSFNLRLDSVYQVIPRKKAQGLTVSLFNIESEYDIKSQSINFQLNKKASKKLVVINGIRVESVKDMTFSSFLNRIPVVKMGKCSVHFVKIDVNDKNRLNDALRVLSTQNYPQPFNIGKIFLQHQHFCNSFRKESPHQNQLMITSTKCIIEQNLYQKIEEMKKQLIKHFTHGLSIASNQKIKWEDSEYSVQYIIGDMLKRNQRAFNQYSEYSNKYEQKYGNVFINNDQEHEYSRKYSTLPFKGKRKMIPRQLVYRNPVYIWQFQ